MNVEDVLLNKMVLGKYFVESYDHQNKKFKIKTTIGELNKLTSHFYTHKNKLLEELKVNDDKILKEILEYCPEYFV